MESEIPIEFSLLSFRPKDDWVAADILVFVKIMALNLGENLSGELKRYEMEKNWNVSRERLKELNPAYPLTSPTVLHDEDMTTVGNDGAEEKGREKGDVEGREKTMRRSEKEGGKEKEKRKTVNGDVLSAKLHDIFRRIPFFSIPNEQHKFSNNWVIHGRHTSTGKPILANDPHLELTAPSIWWRVSLRSPNVTLDGVTFPLSPGVILGTNGVISWGATNTQADVQVHSLFISRTRQPLFLYLIHSYFPLFIVHSHHSLLRSNE